MKTKNEYIESMAAELKEWSAQIDLLTAKTEQSVGMVKLRYTQELNLVRAHQQAATVKLHELETSSEDAWEQVKIMADKIWNDLRSGLASAATKFK